MAIEKDIESAQKIIGLLFTVAPLIKILAGLFGVPIMIPDEILLGTGAVGTTMLARAEPFGKKRY
jgi:hypothetical protein